MFGFEVFSYDFTDQQLELLRNWLIDFVQPEPGNYFGTFVFDGKDAWGHSDPHDEEDYYETWLDYMPTAENRDEMQHEFKKLKQRFGDIHELRFVKGSVTASTNIIPHKEMMVIVSLGSWNEKVDERDARIFYYTDGRPLKRGDTICDGDFIITDMWNQKATAMVQTLRSR